MYIHLHKLNSNYLIINLREMKLNICFLFFFLISILNFVQDKTTISKQEMNNGAELLLEDQPLPFPVFCIVLICICGVIIISIMVFFITRRCRTYKPIIKEENDLNDLDINLY